jgi:hypothetical protein
VIAEIANKAENVKIKPKIIMQIVLADQLSPEVDNGLNGLHTGLVSELKPDHYKNRQ